MCPQSADELVDDSYRALVELMSEGALTLTAEGTVIYSNGRVGPLLGLPRDGLVGRALADFVCEDQRAAFQALLERARETPVGGEFRLRRLDGSEAPFQLSLSSCPGLFPCICLVATDLTEQKRREQARGEEQLTDAIIECAGTSILVCDDAGHILRANGRAKETCGPHLVGRVFDDLFTPEAAFALLKASSSVDPDRRHDLSHLRDDGVTVAFLAGARPIGIDGPGARWVVTLVDITRRHQLEAERVHLLEAERTARAEAELANLAKTKFLAVMSHELRTPLTAVIGYSDLLREGLGGPLVPTQREYVARIKASAWHLLGLIEEILTYARIDAGREAPNLRPIDLKTVAREATAFVEAQARGKGLELRVRFPDEPAIAASDAGRLRQVVLNLLGNAIKFTEQGFVELVLEPCEAGFRFQVRDNGPGIAPEDLERIFEPFVQIDQSTTRVTGGTGLGLTIARQLTALLGGRIEVESTRGVGSCFSVVLPGKADTTDA